MQFSNPDDNIRELGLQSGERVAIFGSGSGGHTFAVARILKGTGSIYGIESRGPLVEKLRKEAAERHIMNIHVIDGNVDQQGGTGLGSLSVDTVIIPDTLFSHANKEEIFREAERILKTDGRMLVIDWSASFKKIGPQPEDIFPQTEAIKMAQNAGFIHDKYFSAGNYHYALIFHKPIRV